MPKIEKQSVTPEAAEMAGNGQKPLDTILLEVPHAECQLTDFLMRVDFRITPREANAMRRVATALDRQQATVGSGVRVTRPQHAIQWLIAQVADMLK